MHVPVSISARGHNSKLRNYGIATARVRKNLACENYFSQLQFFQFFRLQIYYRALSKSGLVCACLSKPYSMSHRYGYTGAVVQA